MLHSTRTLVQTYGVRLAANVCSQTRPNDEAYLYLMKTMTHASSKEVRKATIHYIQAPFSQLTLLFLSKRLRDKDDEIRRLTFMKFH
jgi:steroid 5-alpha reductase family enzyme